MNAQHEGSLVVPAWLSFDRDTRDSRGRPRFKIGNGEAGYGVFRFTDPHEAMRFANNLPEVSRMPAHARAVDRITRAIEGNR